MTRITVFRRQKEVGYHAQMILAGCAIQDSMPRYVATMAVKGLNKVGKTPKGANVLIMGLTYKEDVPDTRESPAENMVEELKDYDINVYGYDPLLTAAEIKHFGAIPLPHLDKKMYAVIIAVAHSSFKDMSLSDIRLLMNSEPVIIDVRGMIDRDAAEKAVVYYWKL